MAGNGCGRASSRNQGPSARAPIVVASGRRASATREKRTFAATQLSVDANPARWAGTRRRRQGIGHPARAITFVPVVSAEHRHSTIGRDRNEQVRAFPVHDEPKLPSRAQLDVEAAISEERGKPAALLRLLVQPAPRRSGWTAAIHGRNGILRRVCEEEDRCGQCVEHGWASHRPQMSAMGRLWSGAHPIGDQPRSGGPHASHRLARFTLRAAEGLPQARSLPSASFQ